MTVREPPSHRAVFGPSLAFAAAIGCSAAGCGASAGSRMADAQTTEAAADVASAERPVNEDGVGHPNADGSETPDGADGSCLIEASNYNQSCSTDSDCVNSAGPFPVDFGNYCAFVCRCGLGAINRNAVDQFVADVSRTPLGSGNTFGQGCSCGFAGGPCCRSGMCTTGSECVCTGLLCLDASSEAVTSD
jgi:hypothetical protein